MEKGKTQSTKRTAQIKETEVRIGETHTDRSGVRQFFILAMCALFCALPVLFPWEVKAGEQVCGAVNEPAPILWKEPGQWREYDRLILQKPSAIGAWAKNMDADQRLELVGKADSQLLYGEQVIILEERGDWLKVAATEHRTALNDLGYPGWLLKNQVSIDEIFLNELQSQSIAVIAKPFAILYKNPNLTQIDLELSYQTRLPIISAFVWISSEGEKAVAAVRLPGGGIGFLGWDDLRLACEIKADRENIVREANQFLGLAYIWAGTSAYGFDCSGFTMRLYQSQGISLPRDADEQALAGTAIEIQAMQPGDLLFFAKDGGKGQVYHVGVYAGNGTMIHSPNSRSAVRFDSIDDGNYLYDYYGARTYIN